MQEKENQIPSTNPPDSNNISSEEKHFTERKNKSGVSDQYYDTYHHREHSDKKNTDKHSISSQPVKKKQDSDYQEYQSYMPKGVSDTSSESQNMSHPIDSERIRFTNQKDNIRIKPSDTDTSHIRKNGVSDQYYDTTSTRIRTHSEQSNEVFVSSSSASQQKTTDNNSYQSYLPNNTFRHDEQHNNDSNINNARIKNHTSTESSRIKSTKNSDSSPRIRVYQQDSVSSNTNIKQGTDANSHIRFSHDNPSENQKRLFQNHSQNNKDKTTGTGINNIRIKQSEESFVNNERVKTHNSNIEDSARLRTSSDKTVRVNKITESSKENIAESPNNPRIKTAQDKNIRIKNEAGEAAQSGGEKIVKTGEKPVVKNTRKSISNRYLITGNSSRIRYRSSVRPKVSSTKRKINKSSRITISNNKYNKDIKLKQKLASDKIPGDKIGWQNKEKKPDNKLTSQNIKNIKIHKPSAQKIRQSDFSRAKIKLKGKSSKIRLSGNIDRTKIRSVNKTIGARIGKKPEISAIPNLTGAGISEPSNLISNTIKNVTNSVAATTKSFWQSAVSATIAVVLFVSSIFSANVISRDRSLLAIAGYTAFDETDEKSKNLTTVAAEDIEKRKEGYKNKILYGNADSRGYSTYSAGGNLFGLNNGAASSQGKEIVDYAKSWVGKITYTLGASGELVEGGKSDCSWFIFHVFNHFDKLSEWHKSLEYGRGTVPNTKIISGGMSNAQPGDILVWDEGGGAGHVIIYAGNNMAVGCNGITTTSGSVDYKEYTYPCGRDPDSIVRFTNLSNSSSSGEFDGSTVYPGSQYALSDSQLQLIADMCTSENFNLVGTAVEASLMCNQYDYYMRNRQSEKSPEGFFHFIYDDPRHWYDTSRGRARYSADEAHYSVVDRVIRQGQHVLPIYIDEHDCISDIGSTSTPGQWIPDVTVIHNNMGSTYTFFCKPPNSDPFGYTPEIYAYYQEHPEAANVNLGPIASPGYTDQKSEAKTQPTKNIKTVHCYSATMDGSPIFMHGNYGDGVVRQTTEHTYAADAVYFETTESTGVDSDGNSYTIKSTTTHTGTRYYTESIGVKETNFTFKYTDKDGNDHYIRDDKYDDILDEEGLSYDEKRHVQAIIGCTTIRTGNLPVEPDKYLDYIYDMVDASITAGKGFKVDFTTYETGQTKTWTFSNGYATAAEVGLRADVVLDLNCNLNELMKEDKVFIWDDDAHTTLMDYYIMDYEYFCMYHQIDLKAGNSGGLTGVAKEIYDVLSRKGMDDVHIAAILGNIQQESSMNPEAVQGSRWKAADFPKVHWDGTSQGVNSENKYTRRGYGLIQWTGGRTNDLQAFVDTQAGAKWTDVDAQMEFFLVEYASNSTGSPWLHGAKSRESFESASDVDAATKVFFDDFEQPGDSTLPIRQRYAREFLAKIQAGGAADVEGYMKWAEQIANDNSHGYSQEQRLANPDYDCSSFVYAALTQAGGYQIDIPWGDFWTGIEIEALTKIGFTKMPFSMSTVQRGDVLWRHGHTEFYFGDGKTIGAHSNFDGRPGDSTPEGKEVCAWDMKGTWEIILRPPASSGSGGGEDANLSIEADVNFDTFNSIAGVKLVIPGQNRNTGESQAFALDIIYGNRDTVDGCYAYAEGIWGQAATPGNAGKNYIWIDEHSEVWLKNWTNMKVCWWDDGTVRAYINGKQIFEDKNVMDARGAQIEGTAMSDGHRIHAEFKNVKVKYQHNGKYGTAGTWRVYGWYGLHSTITNPGKVKTGRNGYCTNGAATYEMSAVMDGVASGANGLNWDTTMKYGNGAPLSTIVQISANI